MPTDAGNGHGTSIQGNPFQVNACQLAPLELQAGDLAANGRDEPLPAGCVGALHGDDLTLRSVERQAVANKRFALLLCHRQDHLVMVKPPGTVLEAALVSVEELLAVSQRHLHTVNGVADRAGDLLHSALPWRCPIGDARHCSKKHHRLILKVAGRRLDLPPAVAVRLGGGVRISVRGGTRRLALGTLKPRVPQATGLVESIRGIHTKQAKHDILGFLGQVLPGPGGCYPFGRQLLDVSNAINFKRQASA
mmetsp:Transcript_108759/g.259581  ORF Transcript_108759/g.259581 Transcript_108759/m.259581 type:complete len:250 (+) Transcript_108759:301-1050(+)